MSKKINTEKFDDVKLKKIMSRRLNINLEKRVNINYNILGLTLIFILLSCIVVYSTSYQSSFVQNFYRIVSDGDISSYSGNSIILGTSNLRKHILVIIVGLVVLFFTTRIPEKYIKNLSVIFYYFTCIMVSLVPIIGVSINGQKRWLNLKVFLMQPSDFYKIGLILFLAAKLYNANRTQVKEYKFWLKLALQVLPFTYFVIHYDLSTGLVLLSIIFVSILLTIKNIKFLMITVVTGIISGIVLLIMTVGYRMRRIDGWLHLESSKEGYQTLQGLYAISSGGMFGKGIGNSIMKNQVPAANNDFVFTIICEEFGIIGGILLIILFCIFLTQIFKLTLKTTNIFYYMILTGTIVHIASQVIINISVTLNLIPNTGIGLPFLSSGGSSMLSFLFELGIILKISKLISVEEIKNRS